MVWIKWVALAIAVCLVAIAALAAIGSWRWSAATRALVERLEAARLPPAPALYDAARELDGLPPPVQRFFRAALKDGQPMVGAVEIEHRGTFNLAAEGPDRWIPFTSTQRVTTRRPGFVWGRPHGDGARPRGARARRLCRRRRHPAPGRDGPGLADRAARHQPRAGGVAQGELMRWLAEAAWYPTALLPSQGVRWSAVDDEHSAQATLADGAVGVTLLLRFDPASGLVDSVRAEARGRTVGKAVLMTPWEGRWSDYAERDGLRVPMRGEVAWLTPQGRRTYWRGSVTALRYELGP